MKYFYILFLLLTLNCQAQYNQHGIIYPDTNNSEDYCCTFFPNEGELILYDEPNGTKIGTLNRKKIDNYGYEDLYSLVIVLNNGDSVNIDLWGDLKEIDNEKMAITFYENSEEYIKILPNAGNFWVSVQDIETNGFRTLSYQSYMTERSGKVLGFYPEETLNLRKAPSSSAEKIETMSHLHEISLTGKHQGQWSEVKVIKLKTDRCEGGENIEEYEIQGWIKVLDNDGNLNIWYYTRGC